MTLIIKPAHIFSPHILTTTENSHHETNMSETNEMDTSITELMSKINDLENAVEKLTQKQNKTDDILSRINIMLMKPKAEPKCKVVYTYEAQDDDELSIKVGDIIVVISKDPSGWWLGRLNGIIGQFPGNYVEEV